MTDTIDWKHTDKAEHDRRIKATALADAARRLGLADGQLIVGTGNRRRVRVEAGLASVSEDTWLVVHELLAVDAPPPAPAPAPRCAWGPPIPADSHHGEVHLYPGGPLCDAHAPWAVAGHPRPVAAPLPPELERRRAQPAAAVTHTVVDDRAIASGKRRATTTTYRAARTAEADRHAREQQARRSSR